MKTTNNIISGNSKTNLSLQRLVEDIIEKSSSGQEQGKIIIKNNVSPNLYITTNEEDIVASVVKGMLSSMMTHAADGDIDISAKELFGNTIKLAVKDNNCYNTYAVACSLQNIVPLTEQMGGYLNITNQRQKITTIEFSFPVAKEDDKQGNDD
jgi:predicted metal-binding transcription factor (methanogenesis marker protein 9)